MTKVSLACNNCKSWHELTMIIMRNHYSLTINFIVALIVVGFSICFLHTTDTQILIINYKTCTNFSHYDLFRVLES